MDAHKWKKGVGRMSNMNDNNIDGVDSPERRNFMAALIGGASAAYAAGLGYVIFRYLTTGIEADPSALLKKIKVEGAGDLSANSSMMFKFGSKPAVLIKDDQGQLHAYSAVCKHLGCTVSYQPEKRQIYCACHGGVYDPITGKNVSGPPPEPLDSFKVLAENDGIYVERV